MAQLQSTGITGSLTVTTGSATELLVTNTGVRIGNIISDTHTVTGSLNISGSLGTVGTITATTLVVQTITSSVATVTGSTKFGSIVSNTHQFTGSILQSGSLATFAGSVGIGTTSPTNTLHVVGTGIVNIVQSSNTVSYTQYYNSSTGTNSTNDGLTVGVNGTDAYIFQREAANLIFGTSDTERMRILSGGNVGIGTTSPAYRLDVAAATTADGIRVQQGGSSRIILNGDGVLSWGPSANTGILTWDTGRAVINAQSTNDLDLTTSGGGRIRIATGGNVGIGTTSPTQLLHIYKSGTDNYIKVDAGGQASNYSGIMLSELGINWGWSLRHSAVNDNFFISYQDNTPTFTDVVTINRNGNVGIGTTSPIGLLNIRHNGSGSSVTYSGLYIQNNNAAVGSNIAARIAFDADGGSVGYGFVEQRRDGTDSLYLVTRNAVNGPIGFETSGSTRMYIVGNTGNVGIGTTTVATRLHVSKIDLSNELVAVRIQNNLGYSEFGVQSNYARILANGALLYAGSDGAQYHYYNGNVIMTVGTGNVGIGTTSPGNTLEIAGTSGTTQFKVRSNDGTAANNSGLLVYNAASATAASRVIEVILDPNGANATGVDYTVLRMYGSGNSDLINFYSGATLSLGADGASIMYLKGSNVGIGTTTPNASLDVNGRTNIGGVTTDPYSVGQLIIRHGATRNRSIFMDTSQLYYIEIHPSASGINQINSSYAVGGNYLPLALSARQNSSDLYLSTGGLVGIGTASPAGRLHIKSSGLGTYPLLVQRAANTNNIFYIFEDASGNGVINLETSGGSTGALIHSSGNSYFNGGNVGIGTTSPSYLFTVRNSSGATVNIGGGNSNTVPAISIQSDSTTWASSINGFAYYYNATNGNLDLYRKDNSTTENQVMTWVRASGNVGIGTLTPSLAKLQVNGNVWATSFTGSFSGSISAPGSNTNVIYNSSGVFAGSNNFVFTGTSVGIGTVSPLNKLEVNAGGTVGYSGNDIVFRNSNGQSALYHDPGGYVYWYSTQAITFYPGQSRSVTFSTGGNVGINTTSPTAKLHVEGTFINNGTTGDVAYISSTFATAATNGRVLHIRDNKAAVGVDSFISVGWTSSPGQDVYIGKRTTSSAGFLAIQNSSATELFTINLSSGNVGVGTTTPYALLTVGGITNSGLYSTDAVVVSGSRAITIGNDVRAGWGLDATTPTSTTFQSKLNIWTSNSDHITFGGSTTFIRTAWEDFKLWINNDSAAEGILHLYHTNSQTEFARFAGSSNNWINGGNLGIGTTSPSYKLDVTGDINFSSTVKFGGVNVIHNTSTDVYLNGRVIYSNSNLNDGMYVGYNSTGGTSAHIRFFANGTNERMRIDAANGSVGIGTTSPGYKLHVNGNLYTNNGLANGSGVSLFVQGSGDVQLTDGGSIFWGAYSYANGTYIRGYDDGDIMYFYSNGTNMGYFRSDRAIFSVNVGIGTTSPAYKLDTRGTGTILGLISTDGTPTRLIIQRSTVPLYLTDMYTAAPMLLIVQEL